MQLHFGNTHSGWPVAKKKKQTAKIWENFSMPKAQTDWQTEGSGPRGLR